jgi:signal transduction histidine kinase
MKQSYDALVEHIQTQQQEIADLKRSMHVLEHQAKKQEKLAEKRRLHVKTTQTLNLGIFSVLEASQVYQLACQSVVHQLQWDAAAVVSFEGSKGVILASYQFTVKQLDHLKEYLGENVALREAYTQRVALSTSKRDDTAALTLRSLFHTDEVVALPIFFGEQFYGYLIACAHGVHRHDRDEEDVEFLATLASQLGHAIQNTTNFTLLEEQNAKLRQMDEIKDSFISITSHQLRTPLSIIKWILSILQGDEKIQKLTDQYKLVEQAYVSNERLIHVVNDLLNVSRIQEGKLPHNPQLSDIHPVLQELVDNAAKLCESKRLVLMAHIETPVPSLQLDPILFKEAIQNILDNAIDYNKEGGFVRVTLEHKEKWAVLSITNTGPGIDAQEQNSIFNQFYRSKRALTQQPNGSGLGLYLSRAIIRQHGGDITCHSEADKETTFTISLPIQ